MTHDGHTVPFQAASGTTCALCGDGSLPVLTVPVVGPDLEPSLPGVCQSCLSVVLKISFQLLGSVPAGDYAAALVISAQNRRRQL